MGEGKDRRIMKPETAACEQHAAALLKVETMRHQLTVAILADLKALGVKPSQSMLDAFELLDGIATRASAAGHAAAGSSGRPSIDVDLKKVAKLKAAGQSASAIARELGVSQSTISRILRGIR